MDVRRRVVTAAAGAVVVAGGLAVAAGAARRCALIRYWHDQDRFVDGLTQGTCRNLGYAGWGLAASAHIAETAHHQGIDLYAEMRTRMTRALEFHAQFDLGEDAPSWLCDGSIDDGRGPTLEVAFNHCANRLGVNLPRTRELLGQTRPGGVSHFLDWETLTHANNPKPLSPWFAPIWWTANRRTHGYLRAEEVPHASRGNARLRRCCL